MVLSRRDSSHEATPSPNKFDGSDDANVGKFFFVYENITMRGKSEEDKAAKLLFYLEGEAFDFYYETFAKDGALLFSAKDYSKVKEALIDQFGTAEEPEDNIRRAISARLDHHDLLGSLRYMECCSDKAGFNPEAKFGLLRNSVMQLPDLAQFAIYRGASTYDALKTTVKDFFAGRTVFFSSRSNDANEKKVTAPAAPKEVMKRPDVLERKVDSLSDQLAQLSLLIKKNQSPGGPSGPSNNGRLCSYCKRSGHGANRCEFNPYRDTKCQRCGKFGHPESSCWMKVAPEAARELTHRVGFEENHSSKDKEQVESTNAGRSKPDQVAVITECNDDAVVAAAKRNSVGKRSQNKQGARPASPYHRC